MTRKIDPDRPVEELSSQRKPWRRPSLHLIGVEAAGTGTGKAGDKAPCSNPTGDMAHCS